MAEKCTISCSERMRRVVLSPHNPNWSEQFKSEAFKLEELLGKNCNGIHHIGSTAIPGIYAKPIIDILVVVNDLSLVDDLNPAFEKLGYACMGEFGIPGRRYYRKGENKRTHHIHLFAYGNSEVTRYLAFRDHMNKHPDTAQGYSWIKRGLAEQFPNDIETYVSGKESFIRMIDYRAGVARNDQLEGRDDIVLMKYDPTWAKLALAEIQAIVKTVELPHENIEHLGSTAVENLKAKPIIDIFIALESIETAKQWIKPLEALGYLYWHENPDKLHQIFFKGMPPYGLKRTHHVHIMEIGKNFNHRVAFRDILQQNETLAKKYEELKCQLALSCADNREMYADSKAVFIKEVSRKP